MLNYPNTSGWLEKWAKRWNNYEDIKEPLKTYSAVSNLSLSTFQGIISHFPFSKNDTEQVLTGSKNWMP